MHNEDKGTRKQIKLLVTLRTKEFFFICSRQYNGDFVDIRYEY
jgi:hypothetical protein